MDTGYEIVFLSALLIGSAVSSLAVYPWLCIRHARQVAAAQNAKCHCIECQQHHDGIVVAANHFHLFYVKICQNLLHVNTHFASYFMGGFLLLVVILHEYVVPDVWMAGSPTEQIVRTQLDLLWVAGIIYAVYAGLRVSYAHVMHRQQV